MLKPKMTALLLRLGRFKMTIFSAVTYSAGASYALRQFEDLKFDSQIFVLGYFFVLFCQLVAHYTGEYHDFSSDQMNIFSTPLTGGSKVLVEGLLSKKICLNCAYFSAAMSIVSLLSIIFFSQTKILTFPYLSPHNFEVLAIGSLMFLIAHQYCSPPGKLNHRGLGELGAAVVMNVLLPVFSALILDSEGNFLLSENGSLLVKLAPLIVPAFFLKFVLILVLNMEDRRPDWQGGKKTLPVLIGEKKSAKMASFLIFLSYFIAILLYFSNFCELTTLISILMSAPNGFGIAISLLKPLPYRLNALALKSLRHAPLVVLGLFFETMAKEIYEQRINLSILIRFLPVIPFLLMLSPKRNKKIKDEGDISERNNRVIIVGGGVGGITLHLALTRLEIPSILFEKVGPDEERDPGADLALWPGPQSILQALEVGRGNDFWKNDLYPINKVFMNATNAQGHLEKLKEIDMAQVCQLTDKKFSLVSRGKLMKAIYAAVPKENLRQGNVVELEDEVCSVKIRLSDGEAFEGALAVGADGIRSVCRKYVSIKKCDNEIRNGGEVCYRGIIDLKRESPDSKLLHLFQEKEKNEPNSMSINYGKGIRFSWGYIDSAKSQGYWFVKQLVGKEKKTDREYFDSWPEPLLSFAKHNYKGIYKHSIQDRKPLEKWSGRRIVLIGDACHAVTPNNGQGACMAIEDAFVLAVLLRRYWNERDGYVEAMYEFESARKSHAANIYKESYKQMKIGQLNSGFGVRLRECVLKMVPASVLQRKLRSCNVFDVEQWVGEYENLRSKCR